MNDEMVRDLPIVIASSVIRSTRLGQSHGGLYLINLRNDQVSQVLDWNDCGINWEGRGSDRGLRGIAFHCDYIYIAASDEIFIFDQHFRQQGSIRNTYLKHCHEIHIADDRLYLTSTGFDSVLVYHLLERRFETAYHLKSPFWKRAFKGPMRKGPFWLRCFDPEGHKGPQPVNLHHINNVYAQEGTVYLSGAHLNRILAINNNQMLPFAFCPHGTHNARPYRDLAIYNDTAHDRVVISDRAGTVLKQAPIIRYAEEELRHGDVPEDHARQAFGRGLCIYRDHLFIAGSSPATISVYNMETEVVVKRVNITMDVRNAIHGLEIWPFEMPHKPLGWKNQTAMANSDPLSRIAGFRPSQEWQVTSRQQKTYFA